MKENYFPDFYQEQNFLDVISELTKYINDYISNELISLIKLNSFQIKEVYEPIIYSILNGGKRVRHLLTLLISEFKNDIEEKIKLDILYTAVSVEFIHTYSLIHDDLPAMDNDDLRRGKPSLHKIFPEWAAILAGDSLNTLAFYLLSQTHFYIREKIEILSRYAGISGMILGQALDLSNEKKDFPEYTKNFIQYESFFKNKLYFSIFSPYLNKVEIEKFYYLMMVHYHKTAALFRASIELGLYSGRIVENTEFSENKKKYYIEYGEILGLLFQITDDILDEVGLEEEVGKKLRKDKQVGKITFPSVFGIEKSYLIAQELSKLASLLTEKFIIKSDSYLYALKYFPFYILNRKK